MLLQLTFLGLCNPGASCPGGREIGGPDTHFGDIHKQCRPSEDAITCSISSGSTLFTGISVEDTAKVKMVSRNLVTTENFFRAPDKRDIW